MSPPSRDPVLGRVLDGRFDVQSRIAQGGMAAVYLALDTRLDRAVAVKVMHPHLAADGAFAARFVREAHAAARLNHTGVVGVYDQGDDDGLVYLVMEYVPGHTLRDVVTRDAPLPPLAAVLLVERVLDALAAAHAAKIVHRDIKPENVLITVDGRVKVADFGLARAITTESSATTAAGLLIGTVSYLAPELVLGVGADARSDVYAVGVVLYELLTGQKPHRGETPIQVAYQHVNADVPSPSTRGVQHDWQFPDYVDALVARATTRDPALRPSDAGVLLRQLRRVRSALEIGLAADAELSADLWPRAGPADQRYRSDEWEREDTVPEQLPRPRIEPAPATATRPAPAEDGREHTLVVGRVALDERPPPPVLPAAPGSERGAPASPRRRRRRGVWWLVIVVVLALLAGLGGWWYGVGRFTDTPRLTELTETQARERAADAGLDVDIGAAAYSERIPVGSVVTTDPEPGDRILADGTITLSLSRGKERYAVPDLRGESLTEATGTLTDGGLELGQPTERYSARVDEGSVITTALPAGKMLRPDTDVDVVVSLGPRPVDVVDYAGQPADEARRALEEAGFEVEVTDREFSDDVADGSVISQDPSAGSGFADDPIDLVVSKGPELVRVPNFTGQDAAAAEAQLDELGFEVSVVESDFYIGLDAVARQSESPGALIPRGTEIVLYLV